MSEGPLQFFERMRGDMDAFYRRQGVAAHADTRHAEIASLCHGPQVLDVGCGTGDLLLLLQERNPEWQLHGTDVSAVALEMAAQRGLRARLERRADVPAGPFDTAVLAQVLEHMDAEAGRWLLDQAAAAAERLIISVPNENAVKSPHHVRAFTAAELEETLQEYGTVELHRWAGEKRRLIAIVGSRMRSEAEMDERVLNLGCGNKLVDGAVNHDRTQHRPEVDVVWDLNELPWPWEDESFDLVVACAVLEHLRITLIDSVNECWRILRPGGVLHLKLPHWQSDNSYRDPTHYWQFSLGTCDIFDPETEYGRRYRFYTERKWRIVQPAELNRAKTSFSLKMQVRK